MNVMKFDFRLRIFGSVSGIGKVKMKFSVAVFVGALVVAFTNIAAATAEQPYIGEWNYTNSPHYGPDTKLCIKLRTGIRLDIDYDTVHNGTKTASVFSTSDVTVDDSGSRCDNSTLDKDETLVLKFSTDQTLSLFFTRDPKVTKDETGNRWELNKIEFTFVYDNATFPDSTEPGTPDVVGQGNSSLAGIATSRDRSFSCTKANSIKITDRFRISFTSLRMQAFMSANDFSPADHCAADQESTDLIPIFIGAALALLVIVVLIAYLIGRARANSPSYDNMK